MLSIPNIAQVRLENPYTYEALVRIVTAINQLGQRTGADPAGLTAAPQSIGSFSVMAANGLFDLAIVDNSPVNRGIYYFAEFDTSPAFPRPRVVPMGPSRNATIFLGNQTLYWRAYSQYPGSPISAKVNFGNPPAAVVGGGVAAPPLQPSQGSGSGAGGGFGDGSGGQGSAHFR